MSEKKLTLTETDLKEVLRMALKMGSMNLGAKQNRLLNAVFDETKDRSLPVFDVDTSHLPNDELEELREKIGIAGTQSVEINIGIDEHSNQYERLMAQRIALGAGLPSWIFTGDFSGKRDREIRADYHKIEKWCTDWINHIEADRQLHSSFLRHQ